MEFVTEIACALIAAVATVLCAIITKKCSDIEKSRKESEEKIDKREKLRAEESRLQLEMLDANIQLTVGVAYALKHGHCNGEVEAGLEKVNKANEKYNSFLKKVAMDELH